MIPVWKRGDGEVFASDLAVELCLFADGGCFAAAFVPNLDGVGGAEVEARLGKHIFAMGEETLNLFRRNIFSLDKVPLNG